MVTYMYWTYLLLICVKVLRVGSREPISMTPMVKTDCTVHRALKTALTSTRVMIFKKRFVLWHSLWNVSCHNCCPWHVSIFPPFLVNSGFVPPEQKFGWFWIMCINSTINWLTVRASFLESHSCFVFITDESFCQIFSMWLITWEL